MRVLRYSLILCAVLAVASCATPEIPYDRAAENVKTIGIIEPGLPDGPTVVLASTVGQSFGLVGALVDAGLQAARDSKFQGALDDASYSERERFVASVKIALEMRGYVVVPVSATRAKATAFMTKYPPKADANVDGYLDLVVGNYGYVSAGIGDSTPYRPSMSVRVKLVRADDAKVLMEDAVVYNPVGPAIAGARAVTISPNPVYSFKDFDTLMGDRADAVKGLQDSVDQTAQTISTLLK